MGFNNGYDSGYEDAKAEFATERAALQKRIKELEAGGGSSGGGEPAPTRDPQLVERYLFVKDVSDVSMISDQYGVTSSSNAVVITEDDEHPFVRDVTVDEDSYPFMTIPIDALLATMAVGDCAVFAGLSLDVVNELGVETVFIKLTAGGQPVPFLETDNSLPDEEALAGSIGVYGSPAITLAVLKTPTGATASLKYA